MKSISMALKTLCGHSVTHDYVEGPGYIKLLLPEGEIDFVASHNLTQAPFEMWQLLGRQVRVETSAEIVAKKLWHRGDRATARDLFDLALVIEREPQALASASEFLVRHRSAFLTQLEQRKEILQLQFDAIDRLASQTTMARRLVSSSIGSASISALRPTTLPPGPLRP